GTVLLDEVGELSQRVQIRLLRFLETRDVYPAGSGVRSASVDVRIIATTNRWLTTSVEDGTFQTDLYYRLNVIHLVAAPLRDRREDIEPLFRHFLSVFGEQYGLPVPMLPRSIVEDLTAYDWPGNVREIQNVAERVIVQKFTAIDAETLGEVIGPSFNARHEGD